MASSILFFFLSPFFWVFLVFSLLKTMSFQTLSPEILRSICCLVTSPADLSALSQTCVSLQHLAGRVLYQQNQQRYHSSALVWAAQQGRLETLYRALGHGCGLDNEDILTAAIEASDAPVVSLVLLRSSLRKSAINIPNKDGRTALYDAVRTGCSEVIDTLLNHGADPRAPCNQDRLWETTAQQLDEDTGSDIGAVVNLLPMPLAATMGNDKIVEKLIKHGADMHDSRIAWPPICLAAAAGHDSTVRLLVTYGARVDDKTWVEATPLYLAAYEGHASTVKLLLSLGARRDRNSLFGLTALNGAVTGRSYHAVKTLCMHGALVNKSNNTHGCSPLHMAARDGQVEIAKLLLQFGAESSVTNINRRTPLHTAVQYGQLGMARLLLDHDHINASDRLGFTALHLAVKQGSIELVTLLLEAGADANIANNKGFYPLHTFASFMTPKIAIGELLLQYDAEVNADTGIFNFQYTALHLAAYVGSVEVIELLIECGADISALSTRGAAPIHLAASRGSIQVVSLLAGLPGVPLTLRDNNGRTPLFHAAMRGHVGVVRSILLNASASMGAGSYLQHILEAAGDIPDVYDTMPVIAATRNGHVDVVKFLLAANPASVQSRDAMGGNMTHWSIKNHNSRDMLDVVMKYGGLYSLGPQKHDAALAKDDYNMEDASRDSACFCEVCTIASSGSEGHVVCRLCDGGNYIVCRQCVKDGVGCRDASHTASWQQIK